jgi:hypothetical protein
MEVGNDGAGAHAASQKRWRAMDEGWSGFIVEGSRHDQGPAVSVQSSRWS